jgi:plasmid stabilization system protein ParE
MAYQIIASYTFRKNLLALNTYLETNWNLAVAKKFHSTIVKLVLILSEQPYIGFPASKKKNVRKI